MCGWSDLHRLFCNVDVGELFELVIHARQLAFDVFRRIWHFLFDPRDIEKHAAMRTSPALFDLAHDATRHVITG